MALSYEEKIIRWIRRIGGFIFLLGLVSFVILSLYADAGLLKFHSYEFEVETNPIDEVQLQDFQVYYDFIRREGKIHFRMTRTNSTNNVVFRLPKELEVSSLNWTSKYSEYDDDFSVYVEGVDYKKEIREGSYEPVRFFVVENLNKVEKEYWSTLELSFKGQLYPNAEFSFTPGTWIIKPPTGLENGAFFKFNLGDKYICAQPCYESFRKEELEFHYRDNKLTVATNKKDQGWEDVNHHIFTLNYNKENNEALVLLRDLSLSLVLLGFFPTLELVLKNLLKINYKRKRRKGIKKAKKQNK